MTSIKAATRDYDLEKNVEQRLVKMVQVRGGLARKFVSPNQRGVPDRIVIWPNKIVHFVELKTKVGKLTKLQEREQQRLRDLGCDVFTLYGKEDVEAYVQKYGGDYVPKN